MAEERLLDVCYLNERWQANNSLKSLFLRQPKEQALKTLLLLVYIGSVRRRFPDMDIFSY
jgi:hypothetical protein